MTELWSLLKTVFNQGLLSKNFRAVFVMEKNILVSSDFSQSSLLMDVFEIESENNES